MSLKVILPFGKSYRVLSEIEGVGVILGSAEIEGCISAGFSHPVNKISNSTNLTASQD